MPDRTEPIVKGSVFEWNGVTCKVQRVDSKEEWADLTCTQGGSSWGKCQSLPLPATFVRIK